MILLWNTLGLLSPIALTEHPAGSNLPTDRVPIDCDKIISNLKEKYLEHI